MTQGDVPTISGPGLPSFVEEDLRRRYVVETALRCVPHHLGEPVFEEVTQGRARYPGYSACGDLGHYCLYRVGCRDARLVNRDEPEAGLHWHVGRNMSMLEGGAKSLACWVDAHEDLLPAPGDIVLIGDMSHGEQNHVFVVVSTVGGPEPVIVSAEYGQVVDGRPASLVGTRVLRRGRVYNSAGKSRTLVGWIDLGLVPLEADPLPYPDGVTYQGPGVESLDPSAS